MGINSRIQMRRTNQAGRFDVSVFPGSYALTAIDGRVPRDWQAPEALEAMVRLGKRIKVGMGERSTSELRLSVR